MSQVLAGYPTLNVYRQHRYMQYSSQSQFANVTPDQTATALAACQYQFPGGGWRPKQHRHGAHRVHTAQA